VKALFDVQRTSSSRRPTVDFRQLVRQLAAVFKARIELRQVGARDETELLGGIGICGRALCCSYWRCRTVKWSREGGANKSKLAGLCNRTLCCLKYESTEVEGKGREGGGRKARPRTDADPPEDAFDSKLERAADDLPGDPGNPDHPSCGGSCHSSCGEGDGGHGESDSRGRIVALDMIEFAR
jgi:hypothetical protein